VLQFANLCASLALSVQRDLNISCEINKKRAKWNVSVKEGKGERCCVKLESATATDLFICLFCALSGSFEQGDVIRNN
jgi:hypothetical protein